MFVNSVSCLENIKYPVLIISQPLSSENFSNPGIDHTDQFCWVPQGALQSAHILRHETLTRARESPPKNEKPLNWEKREEI